MNPVSEDVKDKLVADTIGVYNSVKETEWSIRMNKESTKPRQHITIYDTTAPKPEGYQNRALPPLQSEHVQVRVRGPEQLATYNKAKEIKDAVIAWGRFNTADTKYFGIFPESDVMFLEQTDQDLYVYVVNFRAAREEL